MEKKETKVCPKCGVEKPVDEFAWKNKKKGLRQSSCKACAIEYAAKYREENRERISEYNRKYQQEHKDEIRAYRKTKNYRQRANKHAAKERKEHPERVRERRERFYAAHPNYKKEYMKKWHAEHKEHERKYKYKRYHFLTKYKNLTREQQEELFNNNKELVPHIAKRYKCHEYLYNDMIQAGFVGLWRGIKELDKYKPNKCTLSTWLGWYIMTELGNFSYKAANNSGLSGAMRYAMKRNGGYDDAKSEEDRRLFSTATYLDAPLDRDDCNSNTIAEVIGSEDEYDDGLSEAVKKLLSALNDRDRDCVVRNFGIGCEPQMKKDIAKDYGVSGSTIGNWISAALEKLRDQPGTSSLLVYLS